MSFSSVAELLKAAEVQGSLWRAVLADDMAERGASEENSLSKMRALWAAMRHSDEAYDEAQISRSGLVGGDGGKMRRAAEEGKTICGDFLSAVIARALRVGECNACMKRIVAAPTAGSCGVLPAVLITFQEENGTDDEDMVKALYTASGFGQVVATRACIAGAQGGCQAEVGTAAAMAAAALVCLKNGTPKMAAHGFAMALKNLLGLVCDPVAGLVEVPCVKRNVVGAVDALSCADMALAGIESRILADEVVDAMREVGDVMAVSLKETGQGGLANTPTGREIAARLKQETHQR